MSRTQGTFTYSANLEVLKVLPLDARQLVDTKADLINPVTWTVDGSVWLFNGAIVAVGNDGVNNGIYYLNDATTYTNPASWVKVGSGAGTLTDAQSGLHVSGSTVFLGGALTGDTSFSGGKLKYITHPFFSNDTEIVDKKYVDTVALGLSPKLAVEIATIGNITLSTNQSIDGVTTTDGMRVLVKDQLTGSENGIYSANTGSWGRVADFYLSGQTVQGSLIPVISGNTNSNSIWVLVTDNPINPGVTSMLFGLFSSPTFIAGIGINIGGGTISVDGAALAGNSIQWSGNTFNVDINNGGLSTVLGITLTGATNGLNKVGKNAELGGVLTSDVTINTNAQALVLGKNGFAVKIDPISVIIGDTGFTDNYIYATPALTEINSGAGILSVIGLSGLTLQSNDITVNGSDMRYASHPTFSQDTQLVDKKYVDDKASGSTTYQCSSPSTITVGGLSAGSSLSGCGLDRILEEILAPYIAPAFSSFSNSGVLSTVEVGCVISGTKSFTWGFTNANVQPATMCVRDVTLGSNLATNISVSSPQSVAINTTTFTSCGQQQSWCGSAKNTNAVQFGSSSFVTTALLPYYWGLCTCPGPAGANRPTASCAMVLTGTKVLAGSAGSVSIAFNSTGNDYLWFAVPTAAGADKSTWYINPSNCGLIGGGIGAGCNLFPSPDPVAVTTVCWSGCPYKVYISNKQATASGSMLIG